MGCRSACPTIPARTGPAAADQARGQEHKPQLRVCGGAEGSEATAAAGKGCRAQRDVALPAPDPDQEQSESWPQPPVALTKSSANIATRWGFSADGGGGDNDDTDNHPMPAAASIMAHVLDPNLNPNGIPMAGGLAS